MGSIGWPLDALNIARKDDAPGHPGDSIARKVIANVQIRVAVFRLEVGRTIVREAAGRALIVVVGIGLGDQRTHSRMITSSKSRRRNSAGRFRVTDTPYQSPSHLQQNLFQFRSGAGSKPWALRMFTMVAA